MPPSQQQHQRLAGGRGLSQHQHDPSASTTRRASVCGRSSSHHILQGLGGDERRARRRRVARACCRRRTASRAAVVAAPARACWPGALLVESQYARPPETPSQSGHDQPHRGVQRRPRPGGSGERLDVLEQRRTAPAIDHRARRSNRTAATREPRGPTAPSVSSAQPTGVRASQSSTAPSSDPPRRTPGGTRPSDPPPRGGLSRAGPKKGTVRGSPGTVAKSYPGSAPRSPCRRQGSAAGRNHACRARSEAAYPAPEPPDRCTRIRVEIAAHATSRVQILHREQRIERSEHGCDRRQLEVGDRLLHRLAIAWRTLQERAVGVPSGAARDAPPSPAASTAPPERTYRTTCSSSAAVRSSGGSSTTSSAGGRRAR